MKVTTRAIYIKILQKTFSNELFFFDNKNEQRSILESYVSSVGFDYQRKTAINGRFFNETRELLMKNNKKSIVWTIAGSDSGGGAGIQADLHTFHDLKTYGCSVITALTAQNSESVLAIQETSLDQFQKQLEALASDLPARAIKTGVLVSEGLLDCLCDFLVDFEEPVVVDPVCVTASGYCFVDKAMLEAIRTRLIPKASILTPNLQEASALLGYPVETREAMMQAAYDFCAMGARSALIKEGHGHGELCADYWYDGKEGVWLMAPRIPTIHTHGSGCTLSAAIAALLASGYKELEALRLARQYVQQGIRLAVSYGKGPGPVAHAGWPDDPQDIPSPYLANLIFHVGSARMYKWELGQEAVLTI